MSDCSSMAFKVPKLEFKPCPFHKEAIYPRVSSCDDDLPKNRGWWALAMCQKCDIAVSVSFRHSERKALDDLAKAWNTRHQPTCKWTIKEEAIRGDYGAITECGHIYSFSECPIPEFCASCGGRVQVVD